MTLRSKIVLQSRNTITDFIEYLTAREELLKELQADGIRLFAAGEEELLAHYLMTLKDNKHCFSFPPGYNSILVPEGDWATFARSAECRAQAEADEISYCWDALIETFNRNILGGTSQYSSHTDIRDRERTIRFMAREPRVRRRMLAESLIGLMEGCKPNQRATRVVMPSSPGDPYYVFLLIPKTTSRPEDEYRDVRRKFLTACCLVTKLIIPGALDIVGIATETGIEIESRSEDALYFDARQWTPELEQYARQLQTDLKLLINFTSFNDKIAEFPSGVQAAPDRGHQGV